MLARLIHRRERRLAERHDCDRHVRPFEWGTSFIDAESTADDPPHIFEQHTRDVLRRSRDFYKLPTPVTDYQLTGHSLTWTSAVRTPSIENNTAQARFFPASIRRQQQSLQETGSAAHDERRAIVVLPQWNADASSHVGLCRLFNRFGIAALRLTLPYHEARRAPELTRADYLVSPNVGRTIQSVRQAVLDARAAIDWLARSGYNRIGIIGTSIGSCIGFLTFAHDERLRVGVFNHVSGYFADVVWRGISTRHVRTGLEQQVTLDELRRYWLPISPLPFAEQLARSMPPQRPMRFITGRYDLSFPVDLSRNVIAEARRLKLPLDVAWLPCGHYTLGEAPWKYLDGWKIVSFFRKHL